jgi:RNA ligase
MVNFNTGNGLPPLRLGQGLPGFDDFTQALQDGWLESNRRETVDGRTYVLFNYSRGAQYERHWTEVTTVARGLIVCVETGEIVALPMEKFFNLGEVISEGVIALPKSGPFDALVKMDGSCGIGYRDGDRLCWATRGSFTSPQSVVAQQIWDEKYQQHNHLFMTDWYHVTPVTEIIHPETRVVVRYKFQDLVLIAARNRFTGEHLPYDFLVEMGRRLGMPVVERIPSSDMDAILARVAELDDNHEGFVLLWPDGHRLKVKGEQYKRLHRILSDMTPRVVAQSWLDGTSDELVREVPDEFREETEQTIEQLDDRTVELAAAVDDLWRQAPKDDERKMREFVKQAPGGMGSLLFNRRTLDESSVSVMLSLNTVCQLIDNGRIHKLLGGSRQVSESLDASKAGRHAALSEMIAIFERSVADLLWDNARDEQGRKRLNSKVAPRLAKPLRGALFSALEELRPEVYVEKLRAFLKQPEQQKLYAGLDADVMFAAAPPFDSAIYRHKEWVFSYPGPLRVYLHRWREAGQRQTATVKARALLANAFRNMAVAELVQALEVGGVTELEGMLLDLAEEVAQLWESMPQGVAPDLLHCCARMCTAKEWTTALLWQAWSSYRLRVFDSYLEEAKKLPARFDDEG